MNSTEALALVRMTRALCSGQRLDEYAPDAWAVVLADLRFADAKEALVNLAKIQRFIDPADIRAEVRRIRARRCEGADYPVPPAGLTQAQEREWVRGAWTAIANGEPATWPSRGELTHEHNPDQLAIGRRLD